MISADFWLCLRKFCGEADRGRLAGQRREFKIQRKSTAQSINVYCSLTKDLINLWWPEWSPLGLWKGSRWSRGHWSIPGISSGWSTGRSMPLELYVFNSQTAPIWDHSQMMSGDFYLRRSQAGLVFVRCLLLLAKFKKKPKTANLTSEDWSI